MKNELRNRVIAFLQRDLEHTKPFQLKSFSPVHLIDFNYLKSSDSFKLKVLAHSALSLINNLVENFLLNVKDNPLVEIFSDLEQKVKETFVRYSEEKVSLQNTIQGQKQKIKGIAPMIQELKDAQKNQGKLPKNFFESWSLEIKKFLSDNIKPVFSPSKIKLDFSLSKIEQILLNGQEEIQTMEDDLVDKNKYVTLLENFLQMINIYQNLSSEFQQYKANVQEQATKKQKELEKQKKVEEGKKMQ